MKNFDFALFLRIAALYPGAGFIATLPFVSWDELAGTLTIDVNGASVALAAFLYATIAGGTFAWSRKRKAAGGAV